MVINSDGGCFIASRAGEVVEFSFCLVGTVVLRVYRRDMYLISGSDDLIAVNLSIIIV